MFRLSRENGMPLYLQAENAVRQLIQQDGLTAGSRLPTLDALADRFGIARLTMRQAIKRLEKEGVVSTGRGKGIVLLREAKIPPHMRVQANFREFMDLSRHTLVNTLVNEEVAGCPLLDNSPKEKTYRHWVRVHSDSGIPYGFLDLYLDRKIYRRAAARFDSEPTMHVTTELPSLAGAVYKQRLTIRSALAIEADHLNVSPGMPVAHVLRTGKLGEEYFFAATVVYPGHNLIIDMDLNLNSGE